MQRGEFLYYAYINVIYYSFLFRKALDPVFHSNADTKVEKVIEKIFVNKLNEKQCYLKELEGY